MDFVKEIKDIYEKSFSKFTQQISSQTLDDRAAAIDNAFLHLDNDLSDEALNKTNLRTLSVAMSGT